MCFLCIIVLKFMGRIMMSGCMQVEFNKAAQSLTDAMIPTTQKKSALNRLVKVTLLHEDSYCFCFFEKKKWLSDMKQALK